METDFNPNASEYTFEADGWTDCLVNKILLDEDHKSIRNKYKTIAHQP